MPEQSISSPFIGSGHQSDFVDRLALQLYTSIIRIQDTVEQRRNAYPLSSSSASSAPPTPATQPVTLVCISDTHNTFPTALPPGDILLHAGDLSQYGTFAELQSQLSWLDSQPYEHKIVIAGNHDLLLDSDFVKRFPDRELNRVEGQRRSDLCWGSVRYLKHESVDIEVSSKNRALRIFGSPWTPAHGNFAFQYQSHIDKDPPLRLPWKESIPAGTNIMLTHGPPKAHLDAGGKGCDELLAELWRARPDVVVCGHIHAGRGQKLLRWDRSQACYESVVLRRWRGLALMGLMVLFVWHKITSVLRLRSERARKSTILVNAAVVGGGNSERREAIVVTV